MLTFTLLYNIVLGGLTAMSAAIMALAGQANGALILGGNLFFDNTNNTAPQMYMNTYPVVRLTGSSASLVYGNMSYLTPAQSLLTATGANNFQASILNPIPAATGGSGALVTRLSVECSTLAAARNITIAVNSLTNHGTGGTIYASRKSINIGTPYLYSGSTIFVPNGSYVNLKTSSGAAASTTDCMMKGMFSQKYGNH